MNEIPSESSLFSGVYVATLIPMRADLSIDYEELVAHCNDLVKRGCSGIVLFGTTGEGPSFSVEERKQAIKALVVSGINPRRIILGICCTAIKDAVDLARAALEAYCLGVLVVPPFFYKSVEDEGVISFYREIIQRVCNPDLRMILYHIPQFSGVPLNSNIIQSLHKEFPDIVIGMKDSEGNISLIKQVLKHLPDFKIFVGREPLLSEAVQLGAIGAVSGIANVYPELICSLYEYGKDRRKHDSNGELKHLMETLREYPIFPALKNLVEKKRGSSWHAFRPPLLPLESEQSRNLLKALS